jgi:hypothetical protein
MAATKRVMIVNGTPDVRSKHEVWRMLEEIKPTDVITRNQNGVDAYAYAWASQNNVRVVRMPLSSMVKHLVQQKPDIVLDFGAGKDRTAYDFLRAAKAVCDCRVIPVRY